MSYDIEQEESMDRLKDWWKKHGSKVYFLVIVAAIAMIALRGYQYYLQKQAGSAAALYEIVIDQSANLPTEARLTAFNSLVQDYPSSVYVARTAIALVQKTNDSERDVAIDVLKRALAVNQDAALDGFLRLQLSTQLQKKQHYDEAIQVLAAGIAQNVDEVQALLLDKQGDLYWEKNALPEAKMAYEQALVKWIEKAIPQVDFLRLKLDAVQGVM